MDWFHIEYVIVGIPVIAGIIVLLAASEMSERHHLHHDTYSISQVIPRTIMLVMAFMGVLGGLIGWLCHLGVFSADSSIPMAFFVTFQVSLLLVLMALNRCQVMVYDDRMFVRPLFGRRLEVPYDQIARMERRPLWFVNPHFDDLRIYLADGHRVRVSGLLDVEQILVRIDRFDVLVG